MKAKSSCLPRTLGGWVLLGALFVSPSGWGGSAVVGAGPGPAGASAGACPRPSAGSPLKDPEDLRSHDGVLTVDLTVRSEQQPGSPRFCYLLPDGSESPTLRVKPGDELIINLKNAIDLQQTPETHQHSHKQLKQPANDPCTSNVMSLTSTNLHFHGLTVPPVCHQDEVLKTSIQPEDPPFQYRFKIPADEPPGMYWYHPHIHGFSSKQVMGGASGALIVEGIERVNPDLKGLAERVFVVRDQELLNPNAQGGATGPAVQALLDKDGDAANTGTGSGKPARDLSVNFVPVPYPDYPPATVYMKPGERQLWRVLNASSVTYLNLAAMLKRGPHFRPQWLGVVAIDGVPLGDHKGPAHPLEWRDRVVVSPGGRVEFIMEAPPAGAPAMLVTRTVDTGPDGENDPNRPLISILSSPDAPPAQTLLSSNIEPLPPPAREWIGNVKPVRTRKLYFSEELENPNDSNSPTKFYLTVDGQTPATFDPNQTEPNLVVHQGDVEDWIIENRARELHAFHIHQIHFQVIDWLGTPLNEPYLRDTVNIPYYSPKMSSYPSVRLRMDFRDPNTVGDFVYHCHLLEHEDGGMMGLIRVLPAAKAP